LISLFVGVFDVSIVDSEFYDLWHSLPVPDDVDLLKALSSGKEPFCWKRVLHYTQDDNLDGLAATTAEVVAPKAPAAKKKGKRGGAPRQRQVRITNTHLRGEIDLAGEFAAQSK